MLEVKIFVSSVFLRKYLQLEVIGTHQRSGEYYLGHTLYLDDMKKQIKSFRYRINN